MGTDTSDCHELTRDDQRKRWEADPTRPHGHGDNGVLGRLLLTPCTFSASTTFQWDGHCNRYLNLAP